MVDRNVWCHMLLCLSFFLPKSHLFPYIGLLHNMLHTFVIESKQYLAYLFALVSFLNGVAVITVNRLLTISLICWSYIDVCKLCHSMLHDTVHANNHVFRMSGLLHLQGWTPLPSPWFLVDEVGDAIIVEEDN